MYLDYWKIKTSISCLQKDAIAKRKKRWDMDSAKEFEKYEGETIVEGSV